MFSYTHRHVVTYTSLKRNETQTINKTEYLRLKTAILGLIFGGILCVGCRQSIALEVGLVHGHLKACIPKTSCVSTTSFNSPSQYLPPWLYGSQPKKQAIQQLKTLVSEIGGKINTLSDNYVEAYIPYKIGGQIDEDVDEFLFKEEEGIVVFRSQSVMSLPDPPGCIKRGCINGPRNRGRMEEIRDKLQWQQLETDEDKIWVPLLLH